MKKLTLLVAFFAILFSAKLTYAQSTIFVRAPSYVKIIPSSLPIELFVQPYTNACYLITASELAALTGTTITSFGIHLFYGNANSVASGTMSVYLQNTNDLTYSKGSSFSSCISGMSNVYLGPSFIAATTNSTDVINTLSAPFTYTGGGLYVAFSWTAGVSSTPISLYSYGAASTSFGVIKGQVAQTSALNTMSTTAYRPTFVFGVSNTATNEAGIDVLLAPGKVAEGLHASQVVQATVRNISINTLSNVPVSLSITGANSFTDTQIIPSIIPGTVRTVSFAAFTPTALGSNTLVVSIPNDQYAANNNLSWTQSVTCTEAGHGPPAGNYFEPVAFQGILAGKFNFGAASTMRTLRLAISSTGINDMVYGVLLDQNGTMIAYSNTMVVAPGMPGTFQTFTFTPPRVLLGNTDYYIGMGIPNPNLSTMGCVRYSDGVPGNRFGILPLAGGTFSVGRPAYYGIEPVLNGTITVSPTTSTICKDDQLLLTPSGASIYVWSNSTSNNLPALANGSLLVLPLADESYSINAFDAAGCNGKGSLFLKVDDCTGITKNSADARVELYPNPTVNNKTCIHGLEGINTLIVFNMLGEQVFKTTSNEATINIDLLGRPSGNYLVKLTDANNRIRTMKFIHRE
ncbi:MAG: T9SS type A sorting domain-containing protein [bacterium]|nr:T9SS type A sorting domain-containing protein [bacterium]